MFCRVCLTIVGWTVIAVSSSRAEAPAAPAGVLCPERGTFVERLAAAEIRRYVYLRTGTLLPIVHDLETAPKGGLIAVGHTCRMGRFIKADADLQAVLKDGLVPDQYILKTIEYEGRPVVVVTGHGRTGVLYAAYRLAEHFGVRFYMHGDVIPDRRIAPAMPQLDEIRKPLFDRRGIQPFHDFPEGPD